MQPCLQRGFASTQHLQCSALGRSHGAQDISSHCNASALPFHRGKVCHQRKALHRLSASAGCLHRKSCCSYPMSSMDASVHQQDTLSGSSWLTLSSCRGTQSLRRKGHCIPVFSVWYRWSKKQSMRSRQTTHSRIHPLGRQRCCRTWFV